MALYGLSSIHIDNIRDVDHSDPRTPDELEVPIHRLASCCAGRYTGNESAGPTFTKVSHD